MHVSKRYGPKTALRNINFEIGRGEIVSLLGRNGAGKTTAVRMLLGLASPSSGTVQVCGASPRDSQTRKNIGAMLQVAHLRDTLKPKELVRLFSSYYDRPLPYGDIVRASGLEDIENRIVGKLSGGQVQRVAFALAICGNPKLLVLDEPSVGLDVETRRALWRSIRDFAKRGAGVLLTTHYLQEAEALADRVLVLNEGIVQTEGSPRELIQRTGTSDLEDAFLQLTGANRHLEEVLQ